MQNTAPIRSWLLLTFTLILWGTPAVAVSVSDTQKVPGYAAIAKLVADHLPATTTNHRFDIITPLAVLSTLETCTSIDAHFTRQPQRLAGRTMVELRCTDLAQPTSHYVQINVIATGEYLVASRDLAANHTLQRTDISIQQGDLSQLPRHALLATPNAIAQALGQQLRRSLTQHSVLQANLLSRPSVVNFGDELLIEASGSGFQITRTGEAMDTGAIGDIIRVRLNNKQLLRVEITAAGRARPAQ